MTGIYSKVSLLSDNSSILVVSFYDYENALKQPNTVSYSVYRIVDGADVPIRENVPLTPASTVQIEIQISDIQKATGEAGNWERYIDVFGTFNCSLDGVTYTNQEYRRRIPLKIIDYKIAIA